MSDDLGPIVVDPHAFEQLWPALGVWLILFLAAGDPRNTIPRQIALHGGTPAEATVVGKRKESVSVFFSRERRYLVDFSVSGARYSEPVGARGWNRVEPGALVKVHLRGERAFLDDDLGYSRWKLGLFGTAFVALWLWAAARYRFG